MNYMKISNKQYARILYQVAAGKKDDEIKDTVRNFAEVLAYFNDLGRGEKIINEFVKIWNKEQGIVEAEAISAKELNREVVKLLNGHIAELSGARKVLLSQEADKNILGGVIIKYKDKILDGSLRTQLNELRSEMVK